MDVTDFAYDQLCCDYIEYKVNVTIIAEIVQYQELREDRSTLFMLSLSLSDLTTGCTVMVVSAVMCSNTPQTVHNMLIYLAPI